MTNNNLIASLLRDDKSKMATLIACGASVYALIYYNREVRNQIANIFMVRFLLLLFVVAVVFRWSSFIIIIIIISFWWWWWWWWRCRCSWEREKRRVSSFASVDDMRDGRRVLWCEREEERWRVDKPERDWIFGSKFSLAAVIISSSSSSSERLIFFGLDDSLFVLVLTKCEKNCMLCS